MHVKIIKNIVNNCKEQHDNEYRVIVKSNRSLKFYLIEFYFISLSILIFHIVITMTIRRKNIYTFAVMFLITKYFLQSQMLLVTTYQ